MEDDDESNLRVLLQQKSTDGVVTIICENVQDIVNVERIFKNLPSELNNNLWVYNTGNPHFSKSSIILDFLETMSNSGSIGQITGIFLTLRSLFEGVQSDHAILVNHPGGNLRKFGRKTTTAVNLLNVSDYPSVEGSLTRTSTKEDLATKDVDRTRGKFQKPSDALDRQTQESIANMSVSMNQVVIPKLIYGERALNQTSFIVTVKKGKREELYKCAPSDTLLSLKEQIDEKEGVQPTQQYLFLSGYWLSEPSVQLGDFLKDGDEVILHLPKAATKDFTNNALSTVWLVNGTKHNFKTHLLEKGAETLKLDSETFGIVYHTDGTVPGERKYQVCRYKVANFTKVELQIKTDGKVQVVLFGNILKPQDCTVYDETRNKTKSELVKECLTMAAPVGSFVQGITAIVFGTA